jgi:hypothetical protein
VAFVALALLIAVAGGLVAVWLRTRDGHNGYWAWVGGAWVFMIVAFTGLLVFQGLGLL